MAQRLTLRRRLSYNTNSNRRRISKTPGGKLVYLYLKKPGSVPKCGDCKLKLRGLLPKGKRLPLVTPSVHGGDRSDKFNSVNKAQSAQDHSNSTVLLQANVTHVRCSESKVPLIIRAFLIEEQKIVAKVLKAKQSEEPKKASKK
ncbi:hypothetical protein HPB50_029053 [Hyalomma asiaticum]|nr:hypothetical protein HPB50_029053 [Hyalomma asiaticum]